MRGAGTLRRIPGARIPCQCSLTIMYVNGVYLFMQVVEVTVSGHESLVLFQVKAPSAANIQCRLPYRSNRQFYALIRHMSCMF